MGGEVKTNTSDDFKILETEMSLRHDGTWTTHSTSDNRILLNGNPGMEKLHRSTTSYVKSLSKRNEAEDREKNLPVGHLGTTMVSHGEDFEPDSEFGNCLLCTCFNL